MSAHVSGDLSRLNADGSCDLDLFGVRISIDDRTASKLMRALKRTSNAVSEAYPEGRDYPAWVLPFDIDDDVRAEARFLYEDDDVDGDDVDWNHPYRIDLYRL